MAQVQGCIELICSVIAEMLGDAEPAAAFVCHRSNDFDLEGAAQDIAALARTVKVLRRRELQRG